MDPRNPLPIRADLVIWGAIQNPPLYSMKSIAAKLEVSAAELSDLFGPKPRRSYHKLRKTIEEATS